MYRFHHRQYDQHYQKTQVHEEEKFTRKKEHFYLHLKTKTAVNLIPVTART